MTEYDWSGWSPWKRLNEIEFAAIPSRPGAYVVAARRPIHRAVGVDTLGIIHVGESDDLRRRVDAFRWCAERKGREGHMAGWRYADLGLDRHFPLSTLQLRWVVTDTKEAAYKVEGRILHVYLRAHMELPPLNYKFNWTCWKKES
jgi:hypothetical protein